MFPSDQEYSVFSGIVYFQGKDLFPDTLSLSLEKIRQWAKSKRLLYDLNSQLLTPQTIREVGLLDNFQRGDLQIAVSLFKDDSGKLCYLEYPFISMRNLIKKEVKVEIVYWQLTPSDYDENGKATEASEVRFGFWYPNCGHEFCSLSTGKEVTSKFLELFNNLSDFYETKIIDEQVTYSVEDNVYEETEQVMDITVDGDVLAKFYRNGRKFDVLFSMREN